MRESLPQNPCTVGFCQQPALARRPRGAQAAMQHPWLRSEASHLTEEIATVRGT